MIDVIVDFVGFEGVDPNDKRNPLSELRHRGQSQSLRQIGLARYDNLHQLRPRRLEIRQQPHRLEGSFIEVLCLVNNQNEAPTGAHLLDQDLIEKGMYLREIFPLNVKT